MATETKLVLETLVKWTENARKKLSWVTESLNSINDNAKKATKGINTFWWNLKTLSNKVKVSREELIQLWVVAGGIFVWMTWAIKATTNAAIDQQNALLWLRSIVEWTGKDFNEAEKFIQEFTADWLVPVWNAATSLKNLLARWFWLDEAATIMNRFKDSAAFGRQASLQFWEAIQWATEWLKNENSILVDNAWVTKNVSVMWKEYADSIWVWVKSLTTAQKRQAELNWILHETRFQVWDAAKLADTYAWAVAKNQKTQRELAVTIWTALQPALTKLLETITPIIEKVAEWVKENPELTSKIILVTAAIAWLIAWATALWLILPTIIIWVKALWAALLFLSMNPIWWVITWITALVTAWVLLIKNWDTVKARVLQIWEKIKLNVWGALFFLLKDMQEKWTKIRETVLSFTDSIKETITQTFNDIVDNVKAKINSVIDFFKDAINKIKNLWGSIMSAVWLWGDNIDWARAKWWPVQRWKTFLVWERWPELFTPSQSGNIVPNNMLSSASWGQVNISISGVFGSDAVDEIWDQLVSRLQRSVFI